MLRLHAIHGICRVSWQQIGFGAALTQTHVATLRSVISPDRLLSLNKFLILEASRSGEGSKRSIRVHNSLFFNAPALLAGDKIK